MTNLGWRFARAGVHKRRCLLRATPTEPGAVDKIRGDPDVSVTGVAYSCLQLK
jgi:hypothetical protein